MFGHRPPDEQNEGVWEKRSSGNRKICIPLDSKVVQLKEFAGKFIGKPTQQSMKSTNPTRDHLPWEWFHGRYFNLIGEPKEAGNLNYHQRLPMQSVDAGLPIALPSSNF
jgi:hypothetical protein